MGKVHTAVRLEKEDLDRVDALAPLLGTAVRPALRSDVLRALILHSLEPFEKEHKVKAPVSMADPMRGEQKGRVRK